MHTDHGNVSQAQTNSIRVTISAAPYVGRVLAASRDRGETGTGGLAVSRRPNKLLATRSLKAPMETRGVWVAPCSQS